MSARAVVAAVLLANLHLAVAGGDMPSGFLRAPASEPCPAGTHLVWDADTCIQGAYALLQKEFCYGVPWEKAVQAQADASRPAACYFSISPPGGCGLYLNSAGSEDEASVNMDVEPTIEHTGVVRLCKAVAMKETMVI